MRRGLLMGIFQLGPLSIKYEWAILFAAGLITYAVVKKAIHSKPFSKDFLDTLFNIVFIWIIIYKLSILLFRPSLLLTNPLGLLYFNGGNKGAILALIVCLIYLFWTFKKRSWQKEDLIQGLIITVVSAFLSFWLVRTFFILFIQ
jgi:hypothetical protein